MKGFTYAALFLISMVLVLSFSCSKKGIASCSDGTLNQNEVKIDCGGVCSVCQTCTDGIQNQGETGIDCGGPCAKCPIVYPETGIYGKNLLAFRNYDTTMIPGNYSLSAELPAGSKLRVVFSNPPNGRINYVIVSGGNWHVINANDNLTQSFIVNGAIIADKQFIFGDAFFGSTGQAKMEIYENDAATPTWVKYLKWK